MGKKKKSLEQILSESLEKGEITREAYEGYTKRLNPNTNKKTSKKSKKLKIGIAAVALAGLFFGGSFFHSFYKRELKERPKKEYFYLYKGHSIPEDYVKYIKDNPKYHLQIGSFKDIKNAEKLTLDLRGDGFKSNFYPKIINDKLWFRVYVGPFEEKNKAIEELKEYKQRYGSIDDILFKHNSKILREGKDFELTSTSERKETKKRRDVVSFNKENSREKSVDHCGAPYVRVLEEQRIDTYLSFSSFYVKLSGKEGIKGMNAYLIDGHRVKKGEEVLDKILYEPYNVSPEKHFNVLCENSDRKRYFVIINTSDYGGNISYKPEFPTVKKLINADHIDDNEALFVNVKFYPPESPEQPEVKITGEYSRDANRWIAPVNVRLRGSSENIKKDLEGMNVFLLDPVGRKLCAILYEPFNPDSTIPNFLGRETPIETHPYYVIINTSDYGGKTSYKPEFPTIERLIVLKKDEKPKKFTIDVDFCP